MLVTSESTAMSIEFLVRRKRSTQTCGDAAAAGGHTCQRLLRRAER